MSESKEWDKWLANEDSVNALAPDGYDDGAAVVRVKTLRQRVANALSAYDVGSGSPELYQDGTGLAHYRVTAKGDLRPFAPTLAWIVLSHFGELATVKECQDQELLTKILGALQDFNLKYIPYDYAASKTYAGRCKSLIGFSWANRYFSLVPDFNFEGKGNA